MNKRANLQRLVEPRNVAVLGASEKNPLSREVCSQLLHSDFAGRVILVNRSGAEVLGQSTVRSLSEITIPIDAVLSLVAHKSWAEVEALATALDVGGFVIYGDVETDDLRMSSLPTCPPILGPHALGYVNVAHDLALMAVPGRSLPADLAMGSITMITQSGGLLLTLLEHAASYALGIDLAVATGKDALLSMVEMADYALRRPSTSVVGIVTESLRDPAALVRLALEANRLQKRLVVMILGTSQRGQEGIYTHTGRVASDARLLRDILHQVGATSASTSPEFVASLAVAASTPRVQGNSISAVTISGGAKVMLSDVCEDTGLAFAEHTEATKASLARLLSIDESRVENPLDVGANTIHNPDTFRSVIQVLCADPATELLLFAVHVRQHGGTPAQRKLVTEYVEACDRADKPYLLLSTIPGAFEGYWRTTAETHRGIFLSDIRDLKALAAFLASDRQYSGVARSAPGWETSLGAILLRQLKDRGKHGSSRATDSSEEKILVTESEMYSFLTRTGILVPPYYVGDDLSAAEEALSTLHPPLVIKAQSPMIPHKSEAGCIVFNIRDSAELRTAWTLVQRNAAKTVGKSVDILLQESVIGGHELFVSIQNHPLLGPLLSLGEGGTVQDDRQRKMVYHLIPQELGLMRDELARVCSLFIAPSRVLEVVDYLQLLCESVIDDDRWSEIEINPLVLTDRGPIAVDALGVRKSRREV